MEGHALAKSYQRKGREEQKNEVQDALEAPLTPTGDGVLGLWAALNSVVSGVRLRTDATRRMRRRDNALYLVFKTVERLSLNWQEQGANGEKTLEGISTTSDKNSSSLQCNY